MPRGVPKAGFRKTKNWKKSVGKTAKTETRTKRKYTKRADKLAAAVSAPVFAAPTPETDDQIKTRLRELSLRMAMRKLATLVKMDRKGWKALAEVTCCRNA